MWEKGKFNISGYGGKLLRCEFQAKVYEEPSEYGIDAGRVSKLAIRIDGKVVCNYDRGWDMEPQTRAAKQFIFIQRNNRVHPVKGLKKLFKHHTDGTHYFAESNNNLELLG